MWGKAVLTGLYSALGKLPDSGFICCWLWLVHVLPFCDYFWDEGEGRE